MKAITADKAYLGREILQYVGDMGVKPYIPFKKNSRGLAKGCPLWNTLFWEFKHRQEEFKKVYHQRSNVECCFHMIKTRFGAYIQTKKFDANVNEAKTLFLVHNICILIQEIFERGIDVDFEACREKARMCKR